jgi:pachytene checkpoint protein 2
MPEPPAKEECFMDPIVEKRTLPNPEFETADRAIRVAPDVKDRILAHAVLAYQLRRKFAFDLMPCHGLIILPGPPGTGKTTLARGFANRFALALETSVTFLQVDPHAMTSSAMGRTQREVAKLFHTTVPEAADGPGACVVLLDEVETIVVDRRRLSIESNPIDIHRATDAALAGIDAVARKHPNVLFIATTNCPELVDPALLSRADWIEEIGLPDAEARRDILADALRQLASAWPGVGKLERSLDSFVKASGGLDGRQLRKAVISAAASSVETAKDPGRLTPEQLTRTLRAMAPVQKKEAAE